MSLYYVSLGQVSNPQDLNQALDVLQEQLGGQEKGKYQLNGNSYVNGGIISQYIPSLSRGTTPVSVVIDTADFPPSACNSPTTDNLSASGFHVKATTTLATANANVGGNYTIQY